MRNTVSSSLIVGITDHVQPPFTVEREALGDGVEFVALESADESTYDGAALARLDALLVWRARITAKTVERLDNCRIVVRYGVGYDGVDTAAIKARGVPFCNTPDYGTEEVADTAAAMILGLQRKVGAYDTACRNAETGWQSPAQPPLKRSNAATLGVIGVGRIGTAVVNRMKPFGFRIIGYDPHQPSGHEKAVGYERAGSLDALLAEADIVTVHCPLSAETAGLIDAGFVARMKPGAYLVNTARGAILKDLDVVWDAFRSGHLAGAGLDVLPDEPPGDHPMIDAWRAFDPAVAGRIVINPHTAYYSESAWYEMRYKAAETARLCLVDGVVRNRIV
jgi:D-3-phosphoglycerate dehydrogenase